MSGVTATPTPPRQSRNPWEPAFSKRPVYPDTTHPDTSHTVRNDDDTDPTIGPHTTTTDPTNRATGRTIGTRPDRNPQTNYTASPNQDQS